MATRLEPKPFGLGSNLPAVANETNLKFRGERVGRVWSVREGCVSQLLTDRKNWETSQKIGKMPIYWQFH